MSAVAQQYQDLYSALKDGCTVALSMESQDVHVEIKTKDERLFTGQDMEPYYALEFALHSYAHRIDAQ